MNIHRTNYYIIKSENSWIEGKAIQQFEHTMKLKGIISGVGLPDLHPGKGIPVGAVFLTKDIIYPFIIGNDTGCGMSFFKTGLKSKKIKQSKLIKKISDIDDPVHNHMKDPSFDEPNSVLNNPKVPGTIGGGNHFSEFQVVEKIYDHETFQKYNLGKENLYLLIHSGSRGVGDDILRKVTSVFGARGLFQDGCEAQTYLEDHAFACTFAKRNREMIAKRFMSRFRTDYTKVLDLCHNSITQVKIDGEHLWLHRKGAAPSDNGLVIIPGSRGSLSYLVEPVGNQKKNLFSVAHGAGRKWNRSSVKGRLEKKYKHSDLIKTKLGGYMICHNKNLIYEEAPQAYKSIEIVIKDLIDYGLIKITATLKPVVTYKTRKGVIP